MLLGWTTVSETYNKILFLHNNNNDIISVSCFRINGKGYREKWRVDLGTGDSSNFTIKKIVSTTSTRVSAIKAAYKYMKSKK